MQGAPLYSVLRLFGVVSPRVTVKAVDRAFGPVTDSRNFARPFVDSPGVVTAKFLERSLRGRGVWSAGLR